MDTEKQRAILVLALRLIVERCPRLRRTCYWAGASAISLEETHHRQSFDLDFHTGKALVDVRPLLSEMLTAFPDQFEVLTYPDEFGSGFKGVLKVSEAGQVTIEVLSNYQNVPSVALVESRLVPGLKRIKRERFLEDKVQCLAERSEARDLVDFIALLRHDPNLTEPARQLVAGQDAMILSERLLSWTNEAIEDDLAIYDDVKPGEAVEARDLLLSWIKTDR